MSKASECKELHQKAENLRNQLKLYSREKKEFIACVTEEGGLRTNCTGITLSHAEALEFAYWILDVFR